MAKLQSGTRIYGNLSVDAGLSVGNLYVANTTPATSTTTGALVVSGGASFGKDIWVAGNVYAANLTSLSYSYLTINDPLIYLTSNVTYPYNYSIGFYSQYIGGPSNVYAHTGFVRSPDDNRWHLVSNVGEPTGGNLNVFDSNRLYDPLVTGDHTVSGTVISLGNVIATSNITAQGVLQANAVTTSTNSTTGALLVVGGAGISGNLNIGSNARVLSDTGHILVGDQIRNANVANVWIQGVASGRTGDRPFTLIDSSAVVKVVRPGGDPSIELQAWDSTIATQNSWWDIVTLNTGGNLIIRDRIAGGAGSNRITVEQVTGNVTISSNLRVNNDINFVGNVIHADSGDPVGYIRYLDNISDQFNGSTKKFLITYDDGTVYDVNNPLQLQVFVGGIIVPPARVIRDYFNLPDVNIFDHGFYLQKGLNDTNAVVINTVTTNTAGNIGNVQVSSGGNTIVFATAPTSSMDFQAFVRTNSDPQPAFKFKQTPFTALNIMLGS